MSKSFSILLKYLFFLCCVFSLSKLNAQQKPKQKIAVFIPIYLDEAFDGNTFKIWDNKMPKVMLPGLEFYNGIMFGINTLKEDSNYSNLQIKIYDYKSNNNSISDILKNDSIELLNTKLILGAFNAKNDIKLLADFSIKNHIPLINVNYPNNGGITNNPYYFLLNSTIGTHCKALYNYIVKKHSNDNIIFINRDGSFEDMVTKNFKELDSTRNLLKSNSTLTDSFYSNSLLKMLDSNKNNVIVCATVNEGFAIRIASVISNSKKYKTTLIGMPTWDGIKSFDKKEFKNIDFIYSSPYYNDASNSIVNNIQIKYKTKFDARASDMVFKAYEAIVRFGKTTSLYGENGIKLCSDNLFKVINELDLQPVYNKSNPAQVDYYENQKLYFIKKSEGVTKVMN